ncbi:MAG: hypothetical protein WDO71_14845 [Bacteroidota bacterium]
MTATADILLLVKGDAELVNGPESVSLQIGSPSAIIFAGNMATLSAKNHHLFSRLPCHP